MHSDPPAAGRAAALWVLARAEALEADDLRVALTADDPLLRRQAVRLVADAGAQLEKRFDLLAALGEESDPAVAAELANTIGKLDAKSGLPMLTSLYARHPNDPYCRFFVLRAVPTSAWAEFVERVVTETEPSVARLEPLLSISLAERSGAALETLLERIVKRC